MVTPEPSKEPSKRSPLKVLKGLVTSLSGFRERDEDLTANQREALVKLSQGHGFFPQLAEKLLRSDSAADRVRLVNTPSRGAKFSPLLLSLSDGKGEMARGLSAEEKELWPRLLMELGADPLLRERWGLCVALVPAIYERLNLLTLLLDKHGKRLGSELSREEQMWLYCGAAQVLQPRDRKLQDRLYTALFKGAAASAPREEGYRTLDEHVRLNENLRIGSFLYALHRLCEGGIISTQRAAEVVNARYEGSGADLGVPFSYRLLRSVKAGGNISERAKYFVSLGGDFDATFRGEGGVKTGWHVAADEGHLDELVSKVIALTPTQARLTAGNGDTVLHRYLRRGGHSAYTLGNLAQDRAIFSVRNNAGELPLDILLALGANVQGEYAIPELLKLGADVSDKTHLRAKYDFFRSNPEIWEVPQRIRRLVVRILDGIEPPLRDRALSAVSYWCSPPEDAAVVSEKRALLGPEASPTKLTTAMPALLLSGPEWLLKDLAELIDGGASPSKVDPRTAFHPNEAELLLMLSGDTQRHWSKEYTQWVLYALTSTRRYDAQGITEITDKVRSLWQDIGTIGFEFLNVKYDARMYEDPRGNKTSLLEEYGFERRLSFPHRDAKEVRIQHIHGPRFRLKESYRDGIARVDRVTTPEGIKRRAIRFDKDTELNLYRTHLSIRHPQHGEIIIRNSAPDGGRNALLHPFYLLSAEDLANLQGEAEAADRRGGWSFEQIEKHFTEGLAHALYPDGSLGPVGLGARYLVNQYRAVMSDYSEWSGDFSESAYFTGEEGRPRYLVGGYKSPGFKCRIEALTFWMKQGERMELAVCRRDFPAWGGYATLPLTPHALAALARLNEGDFDVPDLRSARVFDVVQAAINNWEGFVIRSAT